MQHVKNNLKIPIDQLAVKAYRKYSYFIGLCISFLCEDVSSDYTHTSLAI